MTTEAGTGVMWPHTEEAWHLRRQGTDPQPRPRNLRSAVLPTP